MIVSKKTILYQKGERAERGDMIQILKEQMKYYTGKMNNFWDLEKNYLNPKCILYLNWDKIGYILSKK